MLSMTEKQKRAARDADFKRREQPRMVYVCNKGDAPAIKVTDAKGNVTYHAKPEVQKRKARLTEAQDNAIGRAIRRRLNRRRRAAGKPHAAR